MTKVIDISKWQSTYNAETAKAQGVNDVILRAAYATSKDTCFDTFYATAKAAGQTVGAYGFATWHYGSKNGGDINAARAAMLEQTSAWIAICQGKLDGYFAIDQELESGYTMGLTPNDNEILLNECIAMLSAAGFVPCVYCSVSWAMAQFNKNNINADLWLAYYPSAYASADFADAPDYAAMNGTYYTYMQNCGDQLCGWQFGSTGWGAKYGCGSDNLDRNLFYKSAGTVQNSTAYSADAIQLKISGFGTNFAQISAYIGSLGIICDTSTLGDGYFITGFASSGDQVNILNQCAALAIEVAPYFAPLSAEPVQLGIEAGMYTVFDSICKFVGGMGIVCYTALLEGYIVTGKATTAQQQAILAENLNWGSDIWVYTAPAAEDVPKPEATPEAEQPEPEVEPEPEAEVLPDSAPDEEATPPESDAAPEGDVVPEADAIPDSDGEPDSDGTQDPSSDRNAQINALLALIKKLLQKVLDLLA